MRFGVMRDTMGRGAKVVEMGWDGRGTHWTGLAW